MPRKKKAVSMRMTEEASRMIYLRNMFRYVALDGPLVDAIGSRAQQCGRVPETHIQQKDRRDGPGTFHVTVINPRELPQALERIGVDSKVKKKKRPQMVDELVKHIQTRYGEAHTWPLPIDLGLGRVQDASSEAYYAVLHWPFGLWLRSQLGLHSSCFHVTAGFNSKDVHGLYKGPATLLDLHQPYFSYKLLKLWSDIAPYYTHDLVFLQRLLHQSRVQNDNTLFGSLAWLWLKANLSYLIAGSRRHNTKDV
ncbi:hypothetical protein BCR43DRAFT_499599 [Syncephalastrum racemosum]|uniref:Swiss Army Knife 2H phosphoesterase domain-containing protein n=1 Tax=Syncephalastrum racemosum TaxID=13706 RepID=A0A1X2GZ94_SYNRA|nr:hypothetical protein BCR43DRAFT_499599 [Syncephalastrum racemosum]